jgi:outer membrane receptor for ferrienterochelin and colicins
MRCTSFFRSYTSTSYFGPRCVWLVSLAVSFILLVSGSVSAQVSPDADVLSLEDLLNAKVYSASKYQQKQAEAPSSVSVITADDIRHYGYRTLQEALQSVTGLYVINHVNYSTLGVRGFAPTGDANGRILFQVNGHALNNNIDDSAPIGNDFPIDMDLVERIEVVRGPSSSMYGADAFMGVVNVITRTGKSQGEQISGEAGSLGTYKETAIYGLNRGNTQAMFSASYWDSAAPGHLDNIENPNGYMGEHDQTRRAIALVSSHGFTLQGVASSAEDKTPSSAQWCGSCHQTDTHATNFYGYADLQYEHLLWKGTQLTARTYYDNYESNSAVNDLRGCSEARCHGTIYDYDTAHGDRVGTELKLSRVFFDKHRITVGSEYRDNIHQAQQNYFLYDIPTTSTTYVNYDRTSAIWGIYAAGEFHLLPKVILNLGVRNDRYNYLFGSKTSPRAALIYSPRHSTNLKFLYGTAFRVPSFSELYYEGMASVSAPNLRPETTRTFEGDWEQQLSRRIMLSAAGFYNNIGSYIQEQTTVLNQNIDQTTFSNSKASAKGGELELREMFQSGIEGRLSYTYQDARNELTGTSLPDAPRHLVKVNIATPVARRMITPAIEAEYMSRSATVWPAISDSAPPVLLNVSLSSNQFWRGFSASGSAYNLVGRSMSSPTFGYFEQTHDVASNSLLPDDRRSFRFKLTWTSGERSGKDKKNEGPHSAGGQ